MTDTESPPALEFVFAAHVTVDRPLDLGDVGKGGRRIVPITGGEFFGRRLRGKVIPGGADWQIIRSDGVAELEARYTLETDDGALIYVRNHALRHGPAEVLAALAAGRSVDTVKLLLPRCDVLRDRRRALCVAHEAHHRLHRRTRAGGCEAPVLSGPVNAAWAPAALTPIWRAIRRRICSRPPSLSRFRAQGRGHPNRARAPRRS